MKCKFCGTMNPDDAESCSVCLKRLDSAKPRSGESFKRKVEFYGHTGQAIPERKTILPMAAGVILIMNAILALFGLLAANILIDMLHPELSSGMTAVNVLFGGLAVFVLVGGVLTILRRMWAICLTACIASFFLALAFGLFCGILQAMLSVAALVFIALSRQEFWRSGVKARSE